MKNVSLQVISILLFINLVGCGTIALNPNPENKNTQTAAPTESTTEGTPEVQNTPDLPAVSDAGVGGTYIGGAVENAMDSADRSKMLRAMDKAPGKSTHWTNAQTGIEYTVTPTKKVQLQDKNYCRQYQITALYPNANEQSVQGVACIASDGNWHTIQT